MRKLVFFGLLVLVAFRTSAEPMPGKLALQTGDYAKARAEIDVALGTGRDAALRLMLARIDIAENKLDEALETISDVLKSEPDNADALSLKGELFAIKASRAGIFRTGRLSKEALAAYEAALEREPKHIEALTGMIRFRRNAPALFGGSTEQALATTEILRRIDPVLGDLEMAAIYKEQNDDEEHVELLQELTRSHPEDPRAWLALGFIEQGARNWPQANNYFISALGAAEDKSEHTVTAQSARYQVGRTAVLSKSNSEAGIKALNDYLEGPRFSDLPDYLWAHYRRGLLHASLENGEQAERDFDIAAATDDRDLKRALNSR